jgi:hypothetical protein
MSPTLYWNISISKSLYFLYLKYELIRESKKSGQAVPIILYKTRYSESFLLLPSEEVLKSTMFASVFQK